MHLIVLRDQASRRLIAFAAYRLDAPSELLSIRIEPQLLTSGEPISLSPDLEIERSDSVPLAITLLRDSFLKEVGADSLASAALLAGITAAQDEPFGWNAIQRTPRLRLRYPDLQKISRREIVVHLPQTSAYEIVLAETLRVTLPGAAQAYLPDSKGVWPLEGAAQAGAVAGVVERVLGKV